MSGRGFPFTDLTGKRFERLIVLKYLGHSNTKRRRPQWSCQCDCGEIITTTSNILQAGHCRSCGCLTREINQKKGTTHGMCYSREYRSYWAAKIRCFSKNCPEYSSYGGSGISMCDRWRDSFEAFYGDMGPMPPDKRSLDRFPNQTGNYEPGNCRWADNTEQSQNTRKNKVYTYLGQSLCLSEWARRFEISRATINGRLLRGWSFEEAIEAEST